MKNRFSWRSGYAVLPGSWISQMRRRKAILYTAYCVLFISALARAQVEISGSQSGTLGPGTYSVVGDIQVLTGDSLEILPGTSFINDPGVLWEISGYFSAIAAEGDSICFTAQNQATGWEGLIFLNSAPVTTLDYCIIEFTRKPFSWIYIAGIMVYGGDGITLTNSRVSNCSSVNYGAGVYAKDAEVHIENCRIVDNYSQSHPEGTGILLDNCDGAQILRNVIAYNDGNGQ
ncbi:MAG: hypothetical protein GQ565_11835 [Candidatus Aegiribacteria sp.]|nr:hypothetical protein [Candidatus Aegiribacteria sp.]